MKMFSREWGTFSVSGCLSRSFTQSAFKNLQRMRLCIRSGGGGGGGVSPSKQSNRIRGPVLSVHIVIHTVYPVLFCVAQKPYKCLHLHSCGKIQAKICRQKIR